MNARERATVLAALRSWQQDYAKWGETWPNQWPQFEDNQGGRIQPLSSEEIDELCERLNTQEVTL